MSDQGLTGVSTLGRHLLDSEEWLIQRVLEYARRQGYTRYTSTLEEAWRLSIQELTTSVVQALEGDPALTEFAPDETFEDDPMSTFAVAEADRHRQRGIRLSMFLGLFKYYRQAYLDRVDDVTPLDLDPARTRHAVTRAFDRLEIAFCSAWAALPQDRQMAELEQANRLMTNEKNRLLTVTESLGSPVILLDTAGRVSYLNRDAAPMLGLPDRPGSYYYRQGPLELEVPDWLAVLVERAKTQRTALDHVHGDGDMERTFAVHVHPMLDVSDKFQGTVVVLHDITSQHRAEAELAEKASVLEKLSLTDPLTGLLNRRGLMAAGQAQVAAARRFSRCLHVLFGDVDHLKRINDRHGHAVGDAALVAVASALQRVVRAADIVARVGGDEFVVLLPDSEELTRDLLSQRLRDQLGGQASGLAQDLTLSFSTGWVRFDPSVHPTFDRLLSDADESMYQAKRRRGGAPTQSS